MACSDLEVRNLLGEFQDWIAMIRVRVRVGPPTLGQLYQAAFCHQ